MSKKISSGKLKNVFSAEFGSIRQLRIEKSAREYAEEIIATVREPLLVLDIGLKVIFANKSFYQTFKVDSEETIGRFIYDLGDGQWDIPKLRKLLGDILPKDEAFDDYEVEHTFETIGRKTMLLNARQIHFKGNTALETFPPIILLAIEDITDMMDVAEMLARHTNQFEEKMAERAGKLEVYIERLEKEINELKKKL